MSNRSRMPTREEILHGPVVATMFRLSWPVMVSSLLNMVYNMTDTFWVGHLPKAENAAAVAGLQVAGPVVWFLVAFAFGFGSSGLALVSQFMGAHNEVDAEKAAGQTMSLAILLGFAVAIIGVVLSPILLPVLTPDRAISAKAISYTRIIFIGMPAIFVSAVYAQIMNAYGDTVTPMLINAITVGLNVIPGPTDDLRVGPVRPHGCGRCRSCDDSVSGAGRRHLAVGPDDRETKAESDLARPASRDCLGQTYPPHRPSRISRGIRYVLRVHCPDGHHRPRTQRHDSVVGIWDRGQDVQHHVADQRRSRGRHSYDGGTGAGRRHEGPGHSRRTAGDDAIVGLMGVASVLLRLITPLVFRAFIPSQPEIIAEGVLFMSIFLWANPFFGLMMGVQSAFQGSGHNVPNMILDLVRLWGLRVPLAWFFAMALKLGSRGVWIGMTVSNVVAGLLSLILVFTVDWRQNVIGHLPLPESLLMGEEAVSSVSGVEVDDRP